MFKIYLNKERKPIEESMGCCQQNQKTCLVTLSDMIKAVADESKRRHVTESAIKSLS